MKAKIREEYKKKREEITLEDLQNYSSIIQGKLLELPEFQNAQTILFYVSMKSEVKTHDILKEALKQEKRVVVPVTVFDTKSLKLSELKDFSELEENKLGILEPKKEFFRDVNPGKLDLIIVPGVVFDLKGYRVGYGHGYYDRLLSQLGPYVTKVGLTLESHIIKELPIEQHDVAVDKIITEKRLIECRSV